MRPTNFSLAAGLLFTVLGILLATSAATGWQIDGSGSSRCS